MSSYYLVEISVFGVLASFLSLCMQFKHLLGILLSLEMMTMNVFVLLYTLGTLVNYSGFLALILITLSVCEASLGLSVLVSMIRACGNDYVFSLCSQKC
uniref:NADH dehydrogenase subunit 4L n=1 Tax=Pila globosa TaxID=759386 RepID=UPI0025A98E05|nr:NADH dehydrogenase subunit 4L [Pila globosa]WIW42432.1 NADH dehydrogenase subunit 4L [Pila globosa]